MSNFGEFDADDSLLYDIDVDLLVQQSQYVRNSQSRGNLSLQKTVPLAASNTTTANTATATTTGATTSTPPVQGIESTQPVVLSGRRRGHDRAGATDSPSVVLSSAYSGDNAALERRLLEVEEHLRRSDQALKGLRSENDLKTGQIGILKSKLGKLEQEQILGAASRTETQKHTSRSRAKELKALQDEIEGLKRERSYHETEMLHFDRTKESTVQSLREAQSQVTKLRLKTESAERKAKAAAKRVLFLSNQLKRKGGAGPAQITMATQTSVAVTGSASQAGVALPSAAITTTAAAAAVHTMQQHPQPSQPQVLQQQGIKRPLSAILTTYTLGSRTVLAGARRAQCFELLEHLAVYAQAFATERARREQEQKLRSKNHVHVERVRQQQLRRQQDSLKRKRHSSLRRRSGDGLKTTTAAAADNKHHHQQQQHVVALDPVANPYARFLRAFESALTLVLADCVTVDTLLPELVTILTHECRRLDAHLQAIVSAQGKHTKKGPHRQEASNSHSSTSSGKGSGSSSSSRSGNSVFAFNFALFASALTIFRVLCVGDEQCRSVVSGRPRPLEQQQRSSPVVPSRIVGLPDLPASYRSTRISSSSRQQEEKEIQGSTTSSALQCVFACVTALSQIWDSPCAAVRAFSAAANNSVWKVLKLVQLALQDHPVPAAMARFQQILTNNALCSFLGRRSRVHVRTLCVNILRALLANTENLRFLASKYLRGTVIQHVYGMLKSQRDGATVMEVLHLRLAAVRLLSFVMLQHNGAGVKYLILKQPSEPVSSTNYLKCLGKLVGMLAQEVHMISASSSANNNHNGSNNHSNSASTTVVSEDGEHVVRVRLITETMGLLGAASVTLPLSTMLQQLQQHKHLLNLLLQQLKTNAKPGLAHLADTADNLWLILEDDLYLATNST